MFSPISFVLLLIRLDSFHISTTPEAQKKICNHDLLAEAFGFKRHLVTALHQDVYFHNAHSLFTVCRGEHERQNAAVGLFCSLKAEGGHGNIYRESAPPRSHPARLAFELHSRGMCFCTSTSLLPPSSNLPFFSASPLRTRCTGTPTSSLKNQQPLMLDEGKRSWRRESKGRGRKEGGVFPLIDS